jgi:voltage-gated potassium channel
MREHGVVHQRKRSQWYENWLQRWVAQRGAFPVLAASVAVLAITAAGAARVTDSQDFHSFGDALWWSVQALTTVGYGDVVPRNTWGRILGGFAMVLGITFLSFLTATVTSLFVSSDTSEIEAALERIEDRLTSIEAAISALR